MMKLSLFVAASISIAGSQAAQMTVHNNCPFTVWPGVYADPSTPAGGIGGQGGFQLDASATQSFDVPDNWKAGRIWGRRNCDFSKQDVQACDAGSCIGGLKCTQPGVPPVSLAELTLVPGGQDNYDISFVDGFNLPISIKPSDGSCSSPTCSKDLNSNCPADLVVKGGDGAAIACKSSCLATGREDYCCSGAHNTPATCPEAGIPSWQFFHSNCPDAYAYAYDEHNGVLRTCNRNGQAPDYTITFCP